MLINQKIEFPNTALSQYKHCAQIYLASPFLTLFHHTPACHQRGVKLNV